MSEMKTFDEDTMTLDDIEDLPAFGTWPSGAYHVRMDDGIEGKTINDQTVRSVNFTLVSVGEISGALDDGESEPKPGDKEGFMFQVQTEIGQGFYKEFLKPICEKLGTKSLKEAREGCKGMELLIVQRRTFNKAKDRNFAQLKKVAVL